MDNRERILFQLFISTVTTSFTGFSIYTFFFLQFILLHVATLTIFPAENNYEAPHYADIFTSSRLHQFSPQDHVN
jgi:hypothetical protein